MKKIFAVLAFTILTLSSSFEGLFAQMTPDLALKRLIEGNDRYVKDQLEHPNHSSVRREAVINNQTPFAVIVACSDSRVSPEIIFDQGLGDLFVVRVAGNVIGPIEFASVDYAVKYLGASIVVIMGHENCGAVKATLEGKTKDIEPIAEKILYAIRNFEKKTSPSLEQATKANVENSAEDLYKLDLIHEMIDSKKLRIVSGYYHLTTGKFEICCELPVEKK